MSESDISVSTMWQGPLPPPEALRQFNSIVPTAADRILTMAEEEQRVRFECRRGEIATENNESTAFYRKIYTGQWMAFIVTMSVLCATVTTALCGHDKVAMILAGSSFVGIVKSFVGQIRRDRPSARNRLV